MSLIISRCGLCGNYVLSCKRRRREGGRGGGRKLAGTACQIHGRSRRFISSPHLTLNCLQLAPPDRKPETEAAQLLFLAVFTSHRGSCFAADAGEIKPLSLILSYRHLFSATPCATEPTPVAYWTRWMAAALSEPA